MLYGAMFSGVSGLVAQGSRLSMISDNISNINTFGFKGSDAYFSTLTTTSFGSTSYSSGGVLTTTIQSISKQGLFSTTDKVTDVSIDGKGLFTVTNKDDLTGDFLFTRAGSFSEDALGNYKNNAGFYLLGWPLDNNAKLPGEAGNLNTTSYALFQSLEVVNLRTISGNAAQTTGVGLGINLKASQSILQGSGDTILFPSTSSNYKNAAIDLIVPDSNAGFELNQGDTITLTPSDPGTAYTFTYDGFIASNDVTAGILGASSITDSFTSAVAGDGFSITTLVSGITTTTTYSFVGSSPSVANAQFNSLETLQEAISLTSGLSARISNNQLYIANYDADNALTFANTGTGGTNFINAGNLNFVGNVAAAGAGVHRFACLYDLSNKIADPTSVGLVSRINSPLSNTEVIFSSLDPLGTLTISATGSTVGAVTSTGNTILAHLGISHASGYVYPTAYDPTNITKNMAYGTVTPQFTRNVRIYDAFGTGHDLQVSFGKTNYNTWAVEIYALNKSEIVSSRLDGQIAYGTLQFNGDGSLRNVSSSLVRPIDIVWSNQSDASEITFNWGTAGQAIGSIGAISIGKLDGMGQLDRPYEVNFVNQNGISAGLLNGVTIDMNGNVIAQFSNGTSRKIYKIPIANFTSPNHLRIVAGNVFAQTTESGDYNLVPPGTGGVGTIQPGALEQANVELSNELTNMIIAQKGYQANSKVIKTVNEMLEELLRVF